MIKLNKDLSSEMLRDKLSLVDPWYQLVIEMLHPICDFSGKTLIEVGCGLGGFLVYLSKNCSEVVGLDISSKAIHVAKGVVKQLGLQDKVNFVIGDAQFIPFKAQSGDILVCSETLEHVPNYERAFGELVRVTKNSGYLCLTVPNFLSTAFFENVILLLVGQPSYVKSHFSVEKEHIFHVFKLKKLLNQQDVNVVTIRSVDFLHLPPRVRKFLRIDWVLKNISNRLENFFMNYFSSLKLAGANIGVLLKKK